MERVRQMNEKMNVLDVQLDNCTAKDAMKIIAEYMQTEELNTVDIVTVDTLMRATQLDGMKEELEKLDLLLPGDMAILEVAKITDRKRIQEMEDQTMLKMVFHYFHKNRCKIFILAGSEEEGDRLQGYLHEAYSGIQVVGMKAVPADESEDDRITNLVNGGEVDCVIASMDFPWQEQFVYRCKEQLNTRMWFGTGHSIASFANGENWADHLKNFIGKRILKREIKKEQKRKEV